MATMQDFGVPGTGSGILHPKVANKFGVYFSASLPAGSEVSSDEANALFRGLSLQTIAVDLPQRVFKDPTPGTHCVQRNGFTELFHEGDLKLTLEDDVTNVTNHGLDLLGSSYRPMVLVAKLDGNDRILEAYLFTGVTVKSVQHGALNYATGRAIHHVLTVSARHMQRYMHNKQGTSLSVVEFVNNVFGAY